MVIQTILLSGCHSKILPVNVELTWLLEYFYLFCNSQNVGASPKRQCWKYQVIVKNVTSKSHQNDHQILLLLLFVCLRLLVKSQYCTTVPFHIVMDGPGLGFKPWAGPGFWGLRAYPNCKPGPRPSIGLGLAGPGPEPGLLRVNDSLNWEQVCQWEMNL